MAAAEDTKIWLSFVSISFRQISTKIVLIYYFHSPLSHFNLSQSTMFDLYLALITDILLLMLMRCVEVNANPHFSGRCVESGGGGKYVPTKTICSISAPTHISDWRIDEVFSKSTCVQGTIKWSQIANVSACQSSNPFSPIQFCSCFCKTHIILFVFPLSLLRLSGSHFYVCHVAFTYSDSRSNEARSQRKCGENKSAIEYFSFEFNLASNIIIIIYLSA